MDIVQQKNFSTFMETNFAKKIMISKISEGVKISVETFYQPEYSNPINFEFMFAYRITIENNNNFPVKLLTRHWYIYEGTGTSREVQGDGVVGVQPEIEPGNSYQYVSGCNLKSELGKMSGSYLFENINNKQLFEVSIPSFEMQVPFKLN